MVIARRNLMAGKALPYDAEVEWIESTDTQYIDTGINGDESTDAIELDFELSRIVAQNRLFSCGEDTFPSFQGYINGSLKYGFRINQSWSGGYEDMTLNRTLWKCDYFNKEHIINGTVYSYTTTSKQRSALTVKVPYKYGVNPPARLKLFGLKYFSNDKLKLNMFPVRFTNENGASEGAMYNRLGVGGMNPDGTARNDGLFRNRGTGAFRIGPFKT